MNIEIFLRLPNGRTQRVTLPEHVVVESITRAQSFVGLPRSNADDRWGCSSLVDIRCGDLGNGFWLSRPKSTEKQ